MPPALTPALALDYVRELSADVRAVLLLGAEGELIAGPERLRADAVALLATETADELEVATAAGVVCAVRSPAHAIVAVCGRFAIPGVVRIDLRAALAAVEARSVGPAEPAVRALGDGAPDRPLELAGERLISAAQRQFGA